jgi:hypothetical protein
VTLKEIQSDFLEAISEIIILSNHGKFDDSKSICNQKILNYKKFLSQKESQTVKFNNDVFILCIALKCFLDYIELSEMIIDPNWINDNKLTEKIWKKYLDCSERYYYISKCMQIIELDNIGHNLEKIEKVFEINHGKGLYASPEFILKNEKCNICNLGVLECDHERGKLYNGKICRGIPELASLKSIAIVEDPKDKRCRLWKWNKNEDGSYRMTVLSQFFIDNFMFEDN